jgi:hypothetical protein
MSVEIDKAVEFFSNHARGGRRILQIVKRGQCTVTSDPQSLLNSCPLWASTMFIL